MIEYEKAGFVLLQDKSGKRRPSGAEPRKFNTFFLSFRQEMVYNKPYIALGGGLRHAHPVHWGRGGPVGHRLPVPKAPRPAADVGAGADRRQRGKRRRGQRHSPPPPPPKFSAPGQASSPWETTPCAAGKSSITWPRRRPSSAPPTSTRRLRAGAGTPTISPACPPLPL